MNEIVTALKNAVGDIRVTYGRRWLVWDSTNELWVVYEHRPYQKTTRSIAATSDEAQAVDQLLAE